MAKKNTEEKAPLTANNTKEEKARALEVALAALDKQFGKGTVMKMGERSTMKVDVVSTGCLDLDFALGVGGILGRNIAGVDLIVVVSDDHRILQDTVGEGRPLKRSDAVIQVVDFPYARQPHQPPRKGVPDLPGRIPAGNYR